MADATSGTGGGLRYVSEEPTLDMVNQGLPDSCAVACVRQLLRDAGIEVPEPELIEDIGVIAGIGGTASTAAKVLSSRHPRLQYVGGTLNDEQLDLFFRRDPWVAFVRTDFGSVHSVIVDGCKDLMVRVRDPWGLHGPSTGTGTRAILRLSDFVDHWKWAILNGIVPSAIK